MNFVEKTIFYLSTIIVFVVITALLTMANGFVVVNLWRWFIFPIVEYQLTLAHAIGISVFVTYMTYQYVPDYKNHDTKFPTKEIARPFIVLLIGYIINCFFM